MTPDELKIIRLKLKLSQARLAKLLGLSSRTVVYRWEKGERKISKSMEILIKLLKSEQ